MRVASLLPLHAQSVISNVKGRLGSLLDGIHWQDRVHDVGLLHSFRLDALFLLSPKPTHQGSRLAHELSRHHCREVVAELTGSPLLDAWLFCGPLAVLVVAHVVVENLQCSLQNLVYGGKHHAMLGAKACNDTG